MIQEPEIPFGGNWTNIKLDAFEKYVNAYLRIMNKIHYWKTVYVDAFAGSGDRGKKERNELQIKLFPDEEDAQPYKGAAERVLSLHSGLSFDSHYFIDTNSESLQKLESKLKTKGLLDNRVAQFIPGDANEYLLKISAGMKGSKNKYAALILLDPFGMTINWEAIASFAGTKSDIWILVPTGVIINRLLDSKGELIFSDKLEAFFGLDKKEIKNEFYSTKMETNLFGEELKVSKVPDAIIRITEFYIRRLKTIWQYVTSKPLKLLNSKNVPIYHFVFASNNKTGLSIANDIIGVIQDVKNKN